MFTAVLLELVHSYIIATEIGNVANVVSACADQPQQTKQRQLFRIKWTIAEHIL